MALDEGFDKRSLDEADRFFEAKNRKQRYDEIEFLKKENMKLLELIANLKKDGFTYDQLTRKIIVCEACGKLIKE